jgi:RNA-directed DNA polymerase
MGRRRLATIALALSFLGTGLALGASLISDALPDAALGGGAAVLALATIASSILFRRSQVPVAAAVGTLAGIALLFYAVLLLDSSPTDIPERPDLVFGLALVGLWVVSAAARIRPGRAIGVGAGLILIGSFGPALAAGSPPSPGGVTWMTALAGLGCLVSGAWAAAVSGAAAAGLRVDAPGPAAPPGPPPVLSWHWAIPLPDRVFVALRIAAATAVYDGALRILAAPAVVQTTPLEIVEGVFGAAWIVFVLGLRRGAPRIAAITSFALDLWELVLPVGLGVTSLIGAAVLIAPIGSFPPDRLSPLELTNAAPVLIAIGVARLAWVTRVAPRWVGVGVGVAWAIGAFAAVGIAGGHPLPAVAATGAAFSGATWIGFGAWLWVLATRIRGKRPIDAFQPPRDTLAVVGEKPLPGASRRRVRAGAARARRPSLSREKRWRRERTKPRFGIDELARRLGVPAAALRSATPTYAIFAIPKRSGGTRTIAAPDPPTKALQRRILRRLLAHLPAHDAVHGFERGRSIVTNAARHAAPAVLVKLDLEDFFAATRAVRIRRYWRVLGWDRESAWVLTRLTTWSGGLPQGAPTSPRLANLVNVRLDARLAGLAAVHGAVYTRYADDLTFSFAVDDGPAVRQLINGVRRICGDEGRYRLHLNRKVEIRRRHERQEITGLIVNDGRPRLGRARRRWLRAVEYRRYSGGSPTIDDAALRGWQALESMIETQAGPSRPPA